MAADAANRSRQYDFEDGVAGQTTTTVTDSIDTVFFNPVPNNPGFSWIDVPGNAGRPLPAGGLMDSVDSVIQVTPPLNAFAGSATYVDVSEGSGLELPDRNRTASNVALRFDGNSNFEDFNTETGLGGIRGVFIIDDDYNNNTPVAGGTNTFENFSLLSQAWVWPDSSAQGTRQIVFQMGVEHGAVTINEDGNWEAGNLGGAGPIVTSTPVQFDTWNHVAVFRGGGSATFYVNGGVAGRGEGFFGTFVPNTSLGGGEFTESPFTGLIDNFTISGTGDLAFDPIVDLDIETGTAFGCDINQDGDCNQADYDIWNTNFGFDNGFGVGDIFTFELGDGDQNGRVDFFDFKLIADGARAAGNSLVVAGVPEPTAVCLLALAGVAAALGRGRQA